MARVRCILIKPTHHAKVLHWFTSWFKWLYHDLNQFNSRLKWFEIRKWFQSGHVSSEKHTILNLHMIPLWLKRLSEFWLDFINLYSDDGLLWSKSIWHHRMKRIRPIFQRNRDLCSLTCCHWLDWRHRAWLIVRRGPHLIVLASYLDISKVIRGHWPQMTLSLP